MAGNKIRTPMPVSQRAKQFAPFQAVGGLTEALRRKEEEHRQMVEQELEKVRDPEAVSFGEYTEDHRVL